MASESSDRRFGIGRSAKNSTPSEESGNTVNETPSGEKDAASAPPASTEKLDQISNGVGQLLDLISAVHDQHAARDKAFDLLYDEQADYKNDFFYERLKPIMRSLLFLLDSIEQFEREIDEHDKHGQPLSSPTVKANLGHFRDQLIDSLHIAEMAPIEPTSNEFDAKTQRAVEVVSVPPEQNNTVQRTIRGGWTIGNKILRPADVVVGKSG